MADEWNTFSNFKNWMEKQNWEDKQLDKDIIDLCTNEMHNYLVPEIMSVREDYFVKFNDYSVSDYRANESLSIPIPYDAVGSKLRDVNIKKKRQG